MITTFRIVLVVGVICGMLLFVGLVSSLVMEIVDVQLTRRQERAQQAAIILCGVIAIGGIGFGSIGLAIFDDDEEHPNARP